MQYLIEEGKSVYLENLASFRKSMKASEINIEVNQFHK